MGRAFLESGFMRCANEYQVVRPGLAFWQVYDPAVKTELCSCALETPAGFVICDPAPLDAGAMEELLAGKEPHAIVLTNGNHERDARRLAREWGVEIWAQSGARGEVEASRWFEPGEVLFGGVETMGLEGFAAGETALYREGVLIFGDAVINLPPYGVIGPAGEVLRGPEVGEGIAEEAGGVCGGGAYIRAWAAGRLPGNGAAKATAGGRLSREMGGRGWNRTTFIDVNGRAG